MAAVRAARAARPRTESRGASASMRSGRAGPERSGAGCGTARRSSAATPGCVPAVLQPAFCRAISSTAAPWTARASRRALTCAPHPLSAPVGLLLPLGGALLFQALGRLFLGFFLAVHTFAHGGSFGVVSGRSPPRRFG